VLLRFNETIILGGFFYFVLFWCLNCMDWWCELFGLVLGL
jgi:hypothetical protein